MEGLATRLSERDQRSSDLGLMEELRVGEAMAGSCGNG